MSVYYLINLADRIITRRQSWAVKDAVRKTSGSVTNGDGFRTGLIYLAFDVAIADRYNERHFGQTFIKPNRDQPSFENVLRFNDGRIMFDRIFSEVVVRNLEPILVLPQ